MVLDKYIVSRLGNKKSHGIYIISLINPFTHHAERYHLVKIGLGKPLYNRLMSYHTPYPWSFYTWLVITSSPTNTPILEKTIHNYARELRQAFRPTDYQGLYAREESGEWWELTWSELEGVLLKVFKDHGELVNELRPVYYRRTRFLDKATKILEEKRLELVAKNPFKRIELPRVNEPNEKEIALMSTVNPVKKPNLVKKGFLKVAPKFKHHVKK